MFKKIITILFMLVFLLPISYSVNAQEVSNTTEIGYKTSTTVTIPSGLPSTGDILNIEKNIMILTISSLLLIGIIILSKKDFDNRANN